MAIVGGAWTEARGSVGERCAALSGGETAMVPSGARYTVPVIVDAWGNVCPKAEKGCAIAIDRNIAKCRPADATAGVSSIAAGFSEEFPGDVLRRTPANLASCVRSYNRWRRCGAAIDQGGNVRRTAYSCTLGSR